MSLVKLVPALWLKYVIKINLVTVDDFVFRLHYRFTFICLVVCSVLITSEQFFGKPFECDIGRKVPENVKNVIETFCWSSGAFTLQKTFLNDTGEEYVAPGVEQRKEGDEIIKHAFYQWVGVVLFLQGLCFYVTHLLWKGWENEKIKNMIMNLNKVIINSDEKKIKVDTLVTHLIKNLGGLNTYAFFYFICEILNFFNVIIQIVFVNYFLGGQFYTYGIDFLKFVNSGSEDRADPMSKIFPKLAKCTFHQFGPTGDVEKLDNLCLLPLNNLNEKIYIVMWFWFSILLIFSGLMIVNHIVFIAFRQRRFVLIRSLHSLVSPRYLKKIMRKANYGDCFLLYMLGKNLDTMHFRDVLIQLSDRLEGQV